MPEQTPEVLISEEEIHAKVEEFRPTTVRLRT